MLMIILNREIRVLERAEAEELLVRTSMKRIVEYLLNCRIDGQHKHIKITDAYKLKKINYTQYFSISFHTTF